ncbi:hypothetical protein ES707_17336 [subsurface metagenome]
MVNIQSVPSEAGPDLDGIEQGMSNVEVKGELGDPPEADKCFGGYDVKKYLVFWFFC